VAWVQSLLGEVDDVGEPLWVVEHHRGHFWTKYARLFHVNLLRFAETSSAAVQGEDVQLDEELLGPALEELLGHSAEEVTPETPLAVGMANARSRARSRGSSLEQGWAGGLWAAEGLPNSLSFRQTQVVSRQSPQGDDDYNASTRMAGYPWLPNETALQAELEGIDLQIADCKEWLMRLQLERERMAMALGNVADRQWWEASHDEITVTSAALLSTRSQRPMRQGRSEIQSTRSRRERTDQRSDQTSDSHRTLPDLGRKSMF